MILRRFYKPLSLVGIFLALLIFLPAKADALSTTFTDGSNNPDGVSLHPIVSKAGGIVTLTTDTSVFKVFIEKDRNTPVDITIKDACSSSGLNDLQNTDLEAAVFANDGTKIRGWTTNSGGGCSGSDIVFSNIGYNQFTTESSIYGDNYKTITVRVRKINSAGLKAFKVLSNGISWVTYSQLSETDRQISAQPGYYAFSAWNATSNTGSNPSSTIQYDFAPDCTYNTGDPVYLKWFDADQGESNQPDSISFDLIDQNSGNTVHVGGGAMGGNGVGSYRYKQVSLVSGHKYLWRWNNVDRQNGVQLWMPFSEFSSKVTCGFPAKGQITKAVCSTVVANYIKGESSGGSITSNLPVKLRFHNGGPGSAINTTYSGNSSGGKYSHATPSYVQNRDTNIDVAVDLLVKDYSKPGDPYVQVDSATINEPCDGGGGATCPSIPSDPTDINLTGDNSKLRVLSGNWTDGSGNLHQQNSYINDHLHDDSNLKGKNDIVWGDSANTNEFQYVIQRITDQYGQDISTPSKHWSPQDKSANPFHINWSPFIYQYPYDDHALTVHYTTWYRSYKYKATDPARDWIPGHWEGSGSNKHWVAGHWGPIKGYRLVYQGTYVYDWHTDPNDTESHPGNGNWAKAECYNRAFQVHDISGSAAINGDNEDPNGATFTFTIPVHFSLPQGDTALHHPNKVCGINYSASYYIKRADGSYGGAMPGHPSDSGPIDPSNCVGGNWADDVTSNFTKSYSTTLVPPMSVGDRICMKFSVDPATGLMDENGSIIPGSTTGPLTSDESCSQPVVDKPYLRVYGSDVIAGYACPNPGDSRIMAYRSSDPAKSGSGTQFAALAFNQISGFGSASVRNSSPQWPYGLSISNSAGIGGGAATQPNDGGFYSGQNTCPTDFYSTITPNAISTTDNNIPDINTYGQIQNEKQTVFNLGGSNLTVNSSNAYFNKKSTIFVDGNVIIKNNLKFQPGSYLAIIAKGNIYVDSSVTRLDGLYVAQPRGANSGIIYTCAFGDNDVASDAWYDDCRSQLVVNGAFVADKIRFHRSLNSIRDSSAKEAPSNFSDGTGTKAAEVFNFSPEIYLYTPIFIQVTTGQPYQYITSLPPVL